jgi:predicted TPR repeat methyltransferase
MADIDLDSKVESLVCAALKFNPEDNYSEEAEKLLEKAININEKCIDAWLNLAYTRFNKGNVDAALKAFEEAEKLCDSVNHHPGHKDVLCGLSVVVRHTPVVGDPNVENGLFDKSIEYAKKAITLDVNYAKAWCMCKFLFFFLI